MENYYKDRKDQQVKYSKKLKKMAESGDKDLSRLKKEYMQWSLEPPNFDRGEYWSEQEVLKELNKKIQEAQEECLTLKLDLVYGLSEDVDTFEPLEKQILKMNKTRDRLLGEKLKRERVLETNKKDIQFKLKGLMDSYRYLEPVDKKKAYTRMKELSSQLVNPNSQVIAYEIEHKELEYRLTQLYEPFILLKIS